MAFSLREIPKVNYSLRERQVFAALPKDGGKISTGDLAALVIRAGEFVSHPRIIITNALRSLETKIEANGESFVLQRDTTKGPYQGEVWLENVDAPEGNRDSLGNDEGP